MIKGSVTNYTFEKELGKGAFGTTWLAKGDDGGVYAVKKFKNKDFVSRKMEEAALLAITSICKDFTPCFIESIDNYIVMDYIDGVNLKELIFEKMPLEERRKHNIEDDLMNGLKKLHDYGLAHQDIKPENLMMTSTGVKYIDFGLSCILSSSYNVKKHNVFGINLNPPCGTAGSMETSPPEFFHYTTSGIRFENNRPVTDKGVYPLEYILGHDVWSIGSVIMSWNTFPDGGNKITTAYGLVINDSYNPLFESLDKNLYDIVTGLLNRVPERRLEFFNNGTKFEPNWNDVNVTLDVRKKLLDWRCTVQSGIDNVGEKCDSVIPAAYDTFGAYDTLEPYD